MPADTPVVRTFDGLCALGVFLALAVAISFMVRLPASVAHASPAALLRLYGATVAAEGGAVVLVLLARRRLAAFFTTRYAWHGRDLGYGALWGLGLSACTTGLVLAERPWLPIHPNNPFVSNPATAHLPTAMLVGLVALIVVAAPLVEEALYRGLLFGGWAQTRGGFWPAAIGSGFLFGLVHGNLSLLLPLTVAGGILASLAARSGTLWQSTAAHAALNLTAVLLAIGLR